MRETEGQSEAIILVKAFPNISKNYVETVCCAGVTPQGEWVRLYPVTFRRLEDARKFDRWDRIRFKWRRPKDDQRPESFRVDQQSIEIIGELPKTEREKFLGNLEITGLNAIAAQGKSLALLRPKQPKFFIESKTKEEIEQERNDYESILKQQDMFDKVLKPLEPCPYKFKYKYNTDDGLREGTCQDWETSYTFFKWQKLYGEQQTLEKMKKVFGEEYPTKGMTFAMGTHSRYPDTWLINGIIRMDEIRQFSLPL